MEKKPDWKLRFWTGRTTVEETPRIMRGSPATTAKKMLRNTTKNGKLGRKLRSIRILELRKDFLYNPVTELRRAGACTNEEMDGQLLEDEDKSYCEETPLKGMKLC